MATSIYPDVKYLILDGSQSDENQEIFTSRTRPNVHYVRSSPDLDIDDYVLKMATGLNLVNTPYALMVDNDDVFLLTGAIEAIKSLQTETSCVFAGGDMLGFLRSHRNKNRVCWPKTNSDPRGFHLKQGLEAINQNRVEFRSLWYSVFRTETLSWCWNEIQRSKVRDPYLIEFLLTDLAFCRGKYYYSKSPLYMRLLNQSNRAIATLGYKTVEQGRQQKSWWHESELGDRVLADLLDVDSNEIESQFIRASAVAGLQRMSLNPKRLLPRLIVAMSDRVPWLTLRKAKRLSEKGTYRLIPLRDTEGMA
jgi:glycosyltransferase domain-containing protein